LWKDAGPGIHLSPSDTPEQIEHKLERDPDLFLVAEEEGRVIGAVLGGYDGRRGIVYHLAVRPERRNKGVGRSLMQELETRLRAKGCIKYYLLVTRDNPEAVVFYEHLGVEVMDLQIMGKALA
jgi:ribosomal protein S18 acetylase RimI-like enzyme